MRRKKAYGPDYRRPWIRRSMWHERTWLSDHAEQVVLVVVLVLVAAGLMLYLMSR